MTENEVLDALRAIGLRGESRSTGAADWRRVFIIDADGITQGRISLHDGQLYAAKWYVEKVANGPVLADERLPWAWLLWTQRRERLDVARWQMALQRARALARAEKAEKQALRDANPLPAKVKPDGSMVERKRKPLQLNVRKHLAQLLLEPANEPG
jgi:hypothetical protein